MSQVFLVFQGRFFPVDRLKLCQTADVFGDGPVPNRYEVKTATTMYIMNTFIAMIERKSDRNVITNDNVESLSKLCNEFACPDFVQQISDFRNSPEHQNLHLREQISRLATQIQQVRTELTAAVSLLNRLAPLPSRITADTPIIILLREVFADFGNRPWELLWRGSRDGFLAQDFHSRCDGHTNTATLILDTDGNVFGGFRSDAWGRRRGRLSRFAREFLFTLRNPHGIPARRFPSNGEFGALPSANDVLSFGLDVDTGKSDLRLSMACDTPNANSTDLGVWFTNDTGLNGETVFTGSKHFTVKEIEVFEIRQ
jgi:hypothetical protein